MCYACVADRKGASWASFSHNMEKRPSPVSLNEHDTYSRVGAFDEAAKWAALAAGEPLFSGASSWLSGAYDWVSENISGLPLGVFSAAAAGLPNVAIAGTKYYVPTHIDQDVLALFSGSQWANRTITYSFPDSRSDFEWINLSASGFKPLSLDSEIAFHGIFKGTAGVMSLTSLEAFTDTTFVYAGRNDADIKLSAYEPGDIINRSHGYYPGIPIYGGDTWIKDADKTAALGSYQYYLLLHELGHSLGLKHSHESGGNLPKMSAQHDSTEYTVMSYNVTGRSQTFMMYDIAALQEMYGADFKTNSGNTVYKWSPQTGETFVNGVGQGKPVSNAILLTIWDGGGIDTYSFENYSTDLKIDLSPGGFSVTSAEQRSAHAKGNVYNALQYRGDARSLIENAIGGSGSDTLTGNAANNALSGNAGNDTLDGASGDDTLNGGLGNDILRGGVGNDKLYGDEGSDFLSGDGGNDVLQGGNGSDTIFGGMGHDTLWGGSSNDRLYGEDGDDVIQGGEGSDILDGGAGIDTLDYSDDLTGVYVDIRTGWTAYGSALGDVISNFENVVGGAGHDTLYGSDGANELNGQAGNDLIGGGAGNDTLWGGAGHDTLYGDDGNDVVNGGAGNDVIQGGAGADTLDGGEGVDTLVYGGADGALVDLRTGYTAGQAAGDVISGFENVVGGSGNDTVYGSSDANELNGQGGNDILAGADGNDTLWGAAGNDWLEGGSGNDLLAGGAGDDRLVGGAGNDALHGEAGRDVFVFESALNAATNVDWIADFSVAEDWIGLSRSVFGGFGASVALAVGAGATAATAQVVYDSATGALSYDADGTGGLAQVKFAQLSAGLALSAANFVLI